VSVTDYMKAQRRFAPLRADETGEIRMKVNNRWEEALRRADDVSTLRY
jgi:hypothetical protein